MQERNFERQVKERLEAFDIPPSAPVWQNIEREIRRKRERRRLILWLLPFLLAGGAFLLWNNSSEDATADRISNTGSQSSQQRSPGHNKEIDQDKATERIPASSIPDENIVVTANDPVGLITEGRPMPRPRSKKTSHGKGALSRKELNIPSAGPSPKQPTASREETNTSENRVASETLQPLTTLSDTTTATETDKKETVPPAVQNLTDTSRPKEGKKEEKKWKIALHASAGYSESAESFFPIAGPGEPTIIPTSVGVPPTQTVSPITKGLYMSAGLQFTKTLSSRVSFSTGIQYSYASTHQLVGEKRLRDSVTTERAGQKEKYTYTNGRSNDYTNRYHYLELPAGVDLQLFNSLPLELHAGFSVSALIGSNGLHYDEGTNTYYRNNDLLRRIGFNWYSGFSYELMKNRLKLGPHLQYGFLSLNTNNSEDKKYLLLAGFRAKWMLKDQ